MIWLKSTSSVRLMLLTCVWTSVQLHIKRHHNFPKSTPNLPSHSQNWYYSTTTVMRRSATATAGCIIQPRRALQRYQMEQFILFFYCTPVGILCCGGCCCSQGKYRDNLWRWWWWWGNMRNVSLGFSMGGRWWRLLHLPKFQQPPSLCSALLCWASGSHWFLIAFAQN